MLKKIILLFVSIMLLVGCSNSNLDDMSLKEIIDESITLNGKETNTNNKGYKYYLPSEFSVVKDNDYIQELLSHNSIYYLNVDAVSYYYKSEIKPIHELNDYEYYEFKNNDKTGYLRIVKNNDNFFVELCYNYAIIEVEIEENELQYAISRGISILNSINYNDLIIEKYIANNNLENGETIYQLPEPKIKNNKNVLEYVDEYENNIDKVYYVDIKEERSMHSNKYQKLVSKLNDYLPTDDTGSKRINMPNLTFVKNGNIIANDNTTSIISTDITPEEYWDKKNTTEFKNKISEYYIELLKQDVIENEINLEEE